MTHAVIGAAIEVHRVLGPGLAESIYEEALSIELTARNVPFSRQLPVKVKYEGYSLGESRLDLIVAGKIVLELKAVDALVPIHLAQLLSYLRITRAPLGLLINFNVYVLRQGIQRVINKL